MSMVKAVITTKKEVTMTKYLAIAFLITGFLVGDAYGEEDEVYYCAGVAGTGFTGAV